MIKSYNLGNSLIYSGKINKMSGDVLEKPRNFYIRPLKYEDSHAMGDLSFCIYESLLKGQECFIHKHDKKYYQQVFDDSNVTYVGAFVGKQMIAMSYVRMVQDISELEAEMPSHRLNWQDNRVAALGGDSVHPDFRGNALNTYMIDYRVMLASMKGASDCGAIIDRNNVWNMVPYFDNDFKMFGVGVDPADGGKIALMHKPLDTSVLFSNNTGHALNFDDFAMINKYLNTGKAGIRYDKNQRQIVFAETDYYTKLKARNNVTRGRAVCLRNMSSMEI